MTLRLRGLMLRLVSERVGKINGFSGHNGCRDLSRNGIVKRQFQHVGCRTLTNDSRCLPILYLFTKEDCSLCDEAKAILKPFGHRFILEEVDITLPENEPWYEMYKYDIPVFHMFEDFLFKHRVDLDVLEKALTDYENKHSRPTRNT